MISKNPILANQATVLLTQPNPRIKYSPFSHLQSLIQPIPVLFCPISNHPITYDNTTPESFFSSNEVELKHVHLSI